MSILYKKFCKKGSQTAGGHGHPHRAGISQWRELPAPDPRARRRDPRGLTGGEPLHQYETAQGAQTRADKGSRLTAAGHGRRCDTWGSTRQPCPESCSATWSIKFAEESGHNSDVGEH